MSPSSLRSRTRTVDAVAWAEASRAHLAGDLHRTTRYLLVEVGFEASSFAG